MPTLRLMSYNVRSLRDDPVAVARVIRTAQPHVVCIQEAPRFLRWRSKCAALARASGLVVVTGGRTAGANLLLSTLSVDVLWARDVLFSKDARLHQRGTAAATIALGGRQVTVAGTHLDLAAEPRLRHVGELHAALDGFAADTPRIVAGDINEDPGSPAWQALERHGRDAWAAVTAADSGDGFTSTATTPRRRIDGVFVDERVTVRSATVIGDPDVQIASDHRPLLVELEI